MVEGMEDGQQWIIRMTVKEVDICRLVAEWWIMDKEWKKDGNTN